MDFKKKRRGIGGVLDRFESDQSKFESHYVNYLLENINFMQDWNLSFFPTGLKGKNTPIPKVLINNFPKKLTKNRPPVISKLSNYTTLNIPELLEKLIIFSSLGKEKLDGFMLECEPKFESENFDKQLTLPEWSKLFDEVSDLYNFLINKAGQHNNPLLPNVICLLNKKFFDYNDEKINDIFKAFNLMLGYSFIYGSFITGEINEEIDNFLALNAPEKDVRKSGFFSSFKSPKYIYSLEDITNQALILEIIELNIKTGNYTKNQSESIITKIKQDPENMLDFILMVLVHYGQTKSKAENNILALKEKLNEISINWETHIQLSFMISEFTSLTYSDKLNQLSLIRLKINSLFYN